MLLRLRLILPKPADAYYAASGWDVRKKKKDWCTRIFYHVTLFVSFFGWL